MTDPIFIAPINYLTNVGNYAVPTFADIDGDGDLDAFVGNLAGNTVFFRNTGTATAPLFTQEAENFGLSDVGIYAAPTLADIDGDGDLDAFVGEGYGNTVFFRNTGTATAPIFTSEAGNFGLSNVGGSAKPTFADIDGDGDLDAFVGGFFGNTVFFRNTGTATAPIFTSEAGNFGLTNVGSHAAPTFADIDGDGDLDAFVGEYLGNTVFFRNTGTATAPIFTSEAGNFGLSDVGNYAAPTFADIDGDGDLDAFVGNLAGNTLFFENQPAPPPPINFVAPVTNSFGLSNVGSFAKPTLADIDGDGDLDAFVGNFDGNTVFFRNTGTATVPSFSQEAGNFGLTDVGFYAAPTFADIDGDGDLDAFVGEFLSDTVFFRNTGTATAPLFTQEAGNFGLSNVGVYGSPTFADIDGDGDLDAFVGEPNGNTVFFRNTGTATVPLFTQEAGNFGLSNVGYNAAPTFADIDGDGDLDAFVGNSSGNTAFFRNTGTATAPIFTSEAGNFGLTDVGNYASPTFADIDGDGNLDAFVGNFDGNILFFGATTGGVNEAPTVANAIANQNTLEDGFFSFTIPANTFVDVDAGDSLTYTATLANGNALPTWLSFDANTRTFSGTPNDPDNGTISIKVTATDTSNASVDDTFDLTVTPVNDAPVAGDDSASANQNTPLTLLAANLLANDTDVDSSTLSITAVSNAVNGTVSLNNSGNIVFTPTTGFTGNGSFNYTVSDGNGGTDVAMVTVAVGVNLNGTNQNDNINGTSGNDIINALNGNDSVFGNAGNDNLVGDNGNDTLYGGTGNDTLLGGNGDDTLNGEAGNDRLEGDNGEDSLSGGDGNDTLLGGNGQDLLVGGAGNDFLNGGKADDILTGGSGGDIFVLEKAAGRDTITDFSLGQGDKIGLSGLSFSQLSFSGDEIRLGNQTLAVLTAFDTTTLTQSNFISV
ncbi:hypothetical protein NIES2100_13410 [Calothrix sp. NIES-2100]|nr:hypothetical protein NIES2100_13410 [Calothrix sp. NIES-2100]